MSGPKLCYSNLFFSLAERRGFLAKKEVKEEFESDKEGNKKKPAKKINPVNLDDIPDAVFQFKLAEIVYIQALEAVPEDDHPSKLGFYSKT